MFFFVAQNCLHVKISCSINAYESFVWTCDFLKWYNRDQGKQNGKSLTTICLYIQQCKMRCKEAILRKVGLGSVWITIITTVSYKFICNILSKPFSARLNKQKIKSKINRKSSKWKAKNSISTCASLWLPKFYLL